MDPLTGVFRPTERAYADAVTAQTMLNLARQQGYKEWADSMEMNIRNLRANASPQTARRDAMMLMSAFKEVDDFSKNFVQPNMGKEKQGYKLLSDEEAIQMGLPEGQKYQMSGEGRVSPISTPGGMETITEVGPDGRTTIRQITGKAAGKKPVDPMTEAKEKDRARAETESFLTQVNMLGTMFDELPQEENTAGSVARIIQSKIPGTAGYDAAKVFESLQGLARVEKMQQLRMDSPTGSTGMGQLSNAEGEALAKAFLGSLDINTRPTTFRKNLLSAQTKLLDEVHGSQRLRQQWLKEGKITPEQNAEVEAQYPDMMVDIKGNLVPRPKPQAPQQPAQAAPQQSQIPNTNQLRNASWEELESLFQTR